MLRPGNLSPGQRWTLPGDQRRAPIGSCGAL